VAARMGWGLVDQALASVTNFALGVIVARSVGASGFGAFSIAFVTYLVALNLSRAVATQPLLIRYAAVGESEWRRGTSLATGAVIVVGAVIGACCVVAAVLARGQIGESLFAIGLTLPGLLLRDTWRFAFIAAGRGGLAVVNDLLLLVTLAAALGAFLLSGSSSVLLPTLAWGGAATIAAVVGSYQAGIRPRPHDVATWWRRQRDIAGRYAGEVAADAVAGQTSVYAIAAIAGLSTVGALQSASLLLGPLNILLQGLTVVAITEGVRLLMVSPRRLRNACLLLSIGLATATLAWGSAMLALPDSVGRTMLGTNWSTGRAVLPQAVLAVTGLSITIGAGVGLRALVSISRSLRARLLSSIALLACGVGGAMGGATAGAAWGVAIGNWIGVVIWWWHFTAALRERPKPSAEPSIRSPIAGSE
jgi:hypothetical protein